MPKHPRRIRKLPTAIDRHALELLLSAQETRDALVERASLRIHYGDGNAKATLADLRRLAQDHLVQALAAHVAAQEIAARLPDDGCDAPKTLAQQDERTSAALRASIRQLARSIAGERRHHDHHDKTPAGE